MIRHALQDPVWQRLKLRICMICLITTLTTFRGFTIYKLVLLLLQKLSIWLSARMLLVFFSYLLFYLISYFWCESCWINSWSLLRYWGQLLKVSLIHCVIFFVHLVVLIAIWASHREELAHCMTIFVKTMCCVNPWGISFPFITFTWLKHLYCRSTSWIKIRKRP